MDTRTVRMLEHLPDDLRIRGWVLSASDCDISKHEPQRYRAVYVRPVDDRLDIQQGSGTYDRRTRQQIMWVSTQRDESPSWKDARQDAIRRMREVDARYRRTAV